MIPRTMWRIVLAVASFCVVAEKAAVIVGVTHPHPVFEGYALAAGAAVILYQSLASIIGGIVGDVQASRNKDAQKAVIACIRSIHELTGLDILSIGCSVYVASHRGLRRAPYLRRDVRFRLSDMPQESDVTWTAGKGAVGTAWKTKRVTHKDWTALAARYGNVEMTRAEFDRLKPSTTSGFTHMEFQTIAAKYAEILAVPIFGDGGCVGVVAVDLPVEGYAGNGKLLDNAAVKQIVGYCANVISNVFGHK